MSREDIRKMAGDAIIAGKMGVQMSGSAVCTAPKKFIKKMVGPYFDRFTVCIEK